MTVNVAVDPNTVIVLLCVAGIIQIGVHVIKRALDVWFDTSGRKTATPADPIERLADGVKEPKPYAPPEVKPENEPVWDGKAPHRPQDRHLFGYRDQPVVLGGNPARFDLSSLPETESETSGRHTKVEADSSTTGVMPAVVDDERALAVVASVSSEDGAS